MISLNSNMNDCGKASIAEELKDLLLGRYPAQLIIQYSDACNATCPQCELRVSEKHPRSKIGKDRMKAIIDSAAEKKVKSLSFTGGEPFLYCDELIELIHYASDAGIKYIRTGTNGFVFMGSEKPGWESRINKLAENLASTKLYTFWISIDSADPEVHERMRGLPGVIKGIEKALPIFHEHGVYPAANLGVNRNTGGLWTDIVQSDAALGEAEFYQVFKESFEKFYNCVIGLGFTISNACYPMSVETSLDGALDAVYHASSGQHVVSFTTQEKRNLFWALMDTIPNFRNKIRIFTPLSNLYAMTKFYMGDKAYGYPCRGGINYFFIPAADTGTYACGFRGRENFGDFSKLKIGKIRDNAYCTKCDWECFRDPSELLGPLMDLIHNPFALLRKSINDPYHLSLWKDDLKY